MPILSHRFITVLCPTEVTTTTFVSFEAPLMVLKTASPLMSDRTRSCSSLSNYSIASLPFEASNALNPLTFSILSFSNIHMKERAVQDQNRLHPHYLRSSPSLVRAESGKNAPCARMPNYQLQESKAPFPILLFHSQRQQTLAGDALEEIVYIQNQNGSPIS